MDKQGNKTGGRKKGTPNKATKKTRDFINDLLEGNQDNIIEALEKVKKKYPVEYIKLWQSLLEFSTPKLSRSEVKADVDSSITFNITKSYDSNKEADKGS